jgi:hypothetical protein
MRWMLGCDVDAQSMLGFNWKLGFETGVEGPIFV